MEKQTARLQKIMCD